MRRIWFIFLSLCGGLLTALLAVALAMALTEATSVTETAVPLDMRAAMASAKSWRSTWVALTDASADCTTFVTHGGGQDVGAIFIARNEARDLAIVADVRDLRECGHVAKVHFIGMLKRIENAQLARYRLHNFAFAERDGVQWRLCAECQPGGEWEPVGWLFAALGFFGWFTVRMYRARIPKVVPASKVQPRPAVPGNALSAKRQRKKRQRK